MSDVSLETCWAFNVLWNNKFRYQAASCWLLLLSHTTMHGSMNIKFINPLWVLAFSVILYHSALSIHCFLHRLTPIISVSSSISATHLFLGLPLILVPIGFHSNILLGVLLSSIRITWPSQAILLLFIYLTMHAFSISSLNFVDSENGDGRLLWQNINYKPSPVGVAPRARRLEASYIVHTL